MFLFYACGIIVTRHLGDPASLLLGDHSTDEQATRYRWIDGRTIYRKVIATGALPNNANKTVPHGISGLDMPISMVGGVSGGAARYPLPYTETGSGAIRLAMDSSSLHITTDTNRTTFSGYVIVHYLKS